MRSTRTRSDPALPASELEVDELRIFCTHPRECEGPTDAEQDGEEPPGETGFYLDVRPVGVNWSLGEEWRVGFDPLSFRLMIPDTGGIPLVEVQMLTGGYMEWRGP